MKNAILILSMMCGMVACAVDGTRESTAEQHFNVCCDPDDPGDCWTSSSPCGGGIGGGSGGGPTTCDTLVLNCLSFAQSVDTGVHSVPGGGCDSYPDASYAMENFTSNLGRFTVWCSTTRSCYFLWN